jgi:serine/threonine-protein kinase
MAPEQARARAVDKRADIWALGCVLYEMLTGQRPFDGEDVAAVLAGVIKSDPDWTLLPPDVPASVRTVLARCLQKDPKQRLLDVGDVRLALDGALTTRELTEVRVEVPAVAPTAVRVPWWRRTPVVTAAALALGAAAAGATAWQLRTPEAPRVTRLTIAHEGPEFIAPTPTSNVAITPDGLRVVYIAGQPQQSSRMYMRSLDSLASTLVATGDGNVFELSMSPDGQWVGFVATPGAILKKVSLASGTTITVVDAGSFNNVRGAAWTPDGRVVLGSSSANGLRAYAASGGSEFEQITRPENEFHQRPALLPGGRALLFDNRPTGQPGEGQVATVDLASGAVKELFPGFMPVYVPTGHIVYAIEGSLRAVAFDPETLQVRGKPVTAADGVATTLNGSGNFAVSGNGALVYVAGRAGGSARRLTWVDRAGKEEPLAAPERAYAYARLSPDGTRIALDVRDRQNDIWVWDVVRQTLTRLTFDPGLNRSPVWTPDGQRIAYSVASDDGEAVFWKTADGSGAPEELQGGESKTAAPMAFTPDGATFLFSSPTAPPFKIWRAPVTGDRKAERVLDAGFSETNAEVSHDGRWMAYESNESGRDEVYVRPWPDVNAGRWQVSTGGGTRPLWSRDGRELFYYWQSAVMSVPLRAGATFSAGTPAVVIKGDYIAPLTGRQYDVTPDGKRFLLIKNAASDGGTEARNQIVVVQNWFEELKRQVPVN